MNGRIGRVSSEIVLGSLKFPDMEISSLLISCVSLKEQMEAKQRTINEYYM
jgi:hypothetical protein